MKGCALNPFRFVLTGLREVLTLLIHAFCGKTHLHICRVLVPSPLRAPLLPYTEPPSSRFDSQSFPSAVVVGRGISGNLYRVSRLCSSTAPLCKLSSSPQNRFSFGAFSRVDLCGISDYLDITQPAGYYERPECSSSCCYCCSRFAFFHHFVNIETDHPCEAKKRRPGS